MLAQLTGERAPDDITVTVERTRNGIISELINLIPTILWVSLILILVIIFYRPIKNSLLPNISSLNVMGVEASFIQNQLEEVARAGEYTGEVENSGQVIRRAQKLVEVVKGSRILVVNDEPQEMSGFTRIFLILGIQVDVAQSTEEALTSLEKRKYDLVVSDLEREGVVDEGERFLKQAVAQNISQPTIFGVREFDASKGVPPYAFGITNRSNELLNLVFDVLERARG
jgi:hypothetical protein